MVSGTVINMVIIQIQRHGDMFLLLFIYVTACVDEQYVKVNVMLLQSHPRGDDHMTTTTHLRVILPTSMETNMPPPFIDISGYRSYN